MDHPHGTLQGKLDGSSVTTVEGGEETYNEMKLPWEDRHLVINCIKNYMCFLGTKLKMIIIVKGGASSMKIVKQINRNRTLSMNCSPASSMQY